MVKWVGTNEDTGDPWDDTWEPAKNLKNDTEHSDSFVKKFWMAKDKPFIIDTFINLSILDIQSLADYEVCTRIGCC